jgi:hypothetical protein
MNRTSVSLALGAALAALAFMAGAHCGPNERQCVYSPCHHGPGTPECQAATGAARITSRIAEPAVREEVREIVIPKVPQLDLPVGPGARPPNAPAPLGRIDTRVPPLSDPRPLPAALPASAIARDVAPQVYAGAFAASREIDNARALEKLQKSHPRLAGSAYLTERREVKLGDIFEQLKRVDARAQQAIGGLAGDDRYRDQRDSLSRASRLLQSFGSGDAAADRPQ